MTQRKGNKKDKSIGAEIVEGLTDLCETMESGQPIEEKFTVRTVVLDLEPQAQVRFARLLKKLEKAMEKVQLVFPLSSAIGLVAIVQCALRDSKVASSPTGASLRALVEGLISYFDSVVPGIGSHFQAGFQSPQGKAGPNPDTQDGQK